MKRYNNTIVVFLLILMIISLSVTVSGCQGKSPPSTQITKPLSPLSLPYVVQAMGSGG